MRTPATTRPARAGRGTLRRLAWLPLISAVLAACGPDAPRGEITLVFVAGGFERPVFAASPPQDATLLVVLEQHTGLVRAIRDGVTLAEPFLDLSGRSRASGFEQGLLGLAFHPQYAENGRFFVNYTDTDGDTVIEAYQVSENPNRADPDSALEILHIPQPRANHNGGMLAFGPDGYLYIGTGDGGGANDPDNAGQRLDTLLGKMLRIDVDGAAPYAIPPDNPFVNDPEALPEIWAYGLRNPWRFSFDRLTGDLWIADVGQNAREEINFQPADSPGGENYGWRVREGMICRPGQDPCDLPEATDPIHDYGRPIGQSITGGYVYRGPADPDLQGAYLFADWVTGEFWSLRYDGQGVTGLRSYAVPAQRVSSFGEDADGHVYVVDHANGTLYRIGAPDGGATRPGIAH